LPQGGVPTNGPGTVVAGPPQPTGSELYPQGGYGFLGTGDPTQAPPIPTTRELPTLPIVPTVEETQTGRLMFGVGVNSNAGVVGNIVIDERNFDIFRIPRGWEEIRNFTAFRGGGQQLRIEAVPGNQLQRYMITFREPYLFDSLVSLGLSGFLYTRQYYGWDEERIGGRVSFGYQFPYRPDLSVNLALGGQNVEISDPRTPTPPQVTEVLGDNALYTARVSLMHDTRDSAFLATEGHLFEIAYEHGFGDFNYPRGSIEAKQYFHTMERADGSGRHVLSFSGQAAISGEDTPVFDNYYAGGFSTIRGFDFRGASPRMFNVPIGGRFMLLGSVEYMVPVTPDDMLRAVVFCDAGTVEEDVEINEDNFRVAPGFGLRITVPALGPAPIALDLAVPVAHAGGDDIQNFSFFVGWSR
jgi:outer membrane protein insertion porin family